MIAERIHVIDDQAWHEIRRSGIGGSDAATVLGLSPWATSFRLYHEKIGDISGAEETESMYWGKQLEPVVAQEFEKRTGKKTQRINAVLRHPEHYFMLANLDRRVVGENAGLEIKTTSQFNERNVRNGDELPLTWFCQVQHYMAVTGYKMFYIAALIGGQEFRCFEAHRDDDFITEMINLEREFWENHVLEGVAPDPDQDDNSTLAELYPRPAAKELLSLDESELLDIDNYISYKATEKQAREKKEEAAARLKERLGEYEAGSYDDGKKIYSVIWSSVNKKSLDTKRLRKDHGDLLKDYENETTYRRFDIKETLHDNC